MGVHNGAKTLEKSIKSVLSTTADIEFIICDDASTDETFAILDSFAKEDKRIIITKNTSNMGLAHSLNKCLKLAQGEFIARQDADDVSREDRFEAQVEFLNNNAEYDFVGSAVRLVNDGEVWGIRSFPSIVDKALIAKYNPFVHPTLMFRRKALLSVDGYREKNTLRCEDYDLIMRLYAKGLKGYNLKECYVDYSENPHDVSKHSLKTRLNELKVRRNGNKLMKTGLISRLYAYKPLLLWAMPKKLYIRMRKRRWENKANKKWVANKLEFKQSMYVLASMVKRNVKTQYRKSVLGIVWTILNPLLYMIVMSVVFSQVLGRAIVGIDYPLYVLTGHMVFNLMRAATAQALPSLVNNYGLLTKTRISYFVFPASHVMASVVNYLFSLVAMIIVMLVRMSNGVRFYWTMIMIVPFLPSILLFSMGLALILSVLYVHFRDIKHIYSVFLMLWMYMTPLFYAVASVSPRVQQVIMLNPMYHFVTYFRTAVLYGEIPSLEAHIICYGLGIIFFTVGALIFKSAKRKVVLYI